MVAFWEKRMLSSLLLARWRRCLLHTSLPSNKKKFQLSKSFFETQRNTRRRLRPNRNRRPRAFGLAFARGALLWAPTGSSSDAKGRPGNGVAIIRLRSIFFRGSVATTSAPCHYFQSLHATTPPCSSFQSLPAQQIPCSIVFNRPFPAMHLPTPSAAK